MQRMIVRQYRKIVDRTRVVRKKVQKKEIERTRRILWTRTRAPRHHPSKSGREMQIFQMLFQMLFQK